MKLFNLIAIGAMALALQSCSLESAEPAKAAPAKPTDNPPVTTEEAPVNPATTKPATFELQISDMTCKNCSAAVTRLIEGVDGVESASVDHVSGKATVKTRPGAKVTEAALREAVDQDYKVESVIVLAQ